MKVYKENGHVYMDDQGNVVELFPNKDGWYKLPENSCNRVWVSPNKLDKYGIIDYGNEVKQPRVLGTTPSAPSTTPRTNVLETVASYLNEKDAETFKALVKKALARKEAKSIEAQIQALLAKKAELEKAE